MSREAIVRGVIEVFHAGYGHANCVAVERELADFLRERGWFVSENIEALKRLAKEETDLVEHYE